MSNDNNQSGGVGILGLLFVLFVGLKLTAIINWSWWWISAPLWGPLALAVVIAVPIGIYAGLKEHSAKQALRDYQLSVVR
jgi:hypothetical protein